MLSSPFLVGEVEMADGSLLDQEKGSKAGWVGD